MPDPSSNSWKADGVWVGEWFVEPHCNRLRDGEDTIQLEPKIMEILVCLIEHEGTTVTKEKFLERVWGETVVTEDVLTRGISKLRKMLDDDPSDPEYIETIRKTGYRLVAPVSHPDPASAEQDTHPIGPQESGRPLAVQRILPERLTAPPLPSAAALRRLLSRRVRHLVRFPRRWWRAWAILALVALLSVGGLIWALFPSSSAPSATTAPFTSFPGKELDPALAPDGQKLAFAWTGPSGDATTDIYVKQPDVNSPLRLTQSSARDYSPAWSPNAQRIAFVRAQDNRYSIHLTPLIGGTSQELLHFEGRRISSLTWGPDRETLVFSAQGAPYGAYSLYRLSVETMDHQPLTDPPDHYHGDLAPTIQRDDGTIAFRRSVTPHVEDIYTFSIGNGGSPTRLTRNNTKITGLDWGAEGQSIVYAVPTLTPRLWRVDASGGSPSPMPVTGLGNNVHQPSIAQTGRMALTQRSTNVNVWRLRRQKRYDRFTKQPLLKSTRWDSSPDISPNGQRIAFVSQRSGQLQIWVASRNGGDATRLTGLDASLVQTPRWGPDGRRIAFTARKDDQGDIYVTNGNGNSPRRLTSAPAEDRAPSWSPDGDTLYFASNRSGSWQIWATPTDSSAHPNDRPAPRQVTTNGGFAVHAGPDPRSLFVVRKQTAGIWRVPKDGGAPTQVVEALAPYDWGNWAVTEYGLYFVRRDAERPLLAYYSFESNRIFRMAFLDDLPRAPSLAVAPGGEWFLFSRDQSQSDILLVDRSSSD